ncbi:MAG: hypothetical protein HY791_31945 [Deltaproteobacteria bacterium]|nr:hypothetical protein [Deltaproteobacteria bacterium]
MRSLLALGLTGCATDFAWFAFPEGARSEILALGEHGLFGLCAYGEKDGAGRIVETPPASTELAVLTYSQTLEELDLPEGRLEIVQENGRALPVPNGVRVAEFDGYEVGPWRAPEPGRSILSDVQIIDPRCPEIQTTPEGPEIGELPSFVLEGREGTSIFGTETRLFRVEENRLVSEIPWAGTSTDVLSAGLREGGDIYWLGGKRLQRVRLGSTIEVLETIDLPRSSTNLPDDRVTFMAGVPGEMYVLTERGILARRESAAWTVVHDFSDLVDDYREGGYVVRAGAGRAYAVSLGVLVEVNGASTRKVAELPEVVGLNQDGERTIATTRAGDIFVRDPGDQTWRPVGRTFAGPEDTGPDGSHVLRASAGYLVTGNGGIAFWVERDPRWTRCKPISEQVGAFAPRADGWLGLVKPRVCHDRDKCFTRLLFIGTSDPPSKVKDDLTCGPTSRRGI